MEQQRLGVGVGGPIHGQARAFLVDPERVGGQPFVPQQGQAAGAYLDRVGVIQRQSPGHRAPEVLGEPLDFLEPLVVAQALGFEPDRQGRDRARQEADVASPGHGGAEPVRRGRRPLGGALRLQPRPDGENGRAQGIGTQAGLGLLIVVVPAAVDVEGRGEGQAIAVHRGPHAA
jgi:hypothetical protein